MAFWDFLKRWFGEVAPDATQAPRTHVPPQPATDTAQPSSAPPAPPARPAPAPPAAPKVQPAPIDGPAVSATDFLPISRAQLAKEAEEVRRNTGWMWFGRRDIIPPVSDPRTKLIDRGMLTQGFLTADELAEIHHVGDQHAKYADRERHIAIKAGESAEQAVEADRADRAARKAEKKAEAAERKKNHAEQIAARKANDILFVGKGVSALMGDRRSHVAKLAETELPILGQPADLAAALGLTVGKLRWLCFHSDVASRIHYIQFEVPKKSGGLRIVSAPHQSLAAAQRWVLDNILAKLPVEQAAHGFVAGRSTLSNAQSHAGQGVLVNVDLEGFFPSIGFPRVRHLFRRLGYSGSIATLLALLCTECPRKKVIYDGTIYFVATGKRGLPQGACTSPAISNQIARKLDRRLTGLAMKLGIVYTRYADDLTFSANKAFNDKVGYLLARIRHVAKDEGFALNPAKTRVKRAHTRQIVTGLVVNDKPAVPRDIVRRMRAILHQAKKSGLAQQNRQNIPNFQAWVEGMIAYISMVRPETGAKFRQMFDEIVGRSS